MVIASFEAAVASLVDQETAAMKKKNQHPNPNPAAEPPSRKKRKRRRTWDEIYNELKAFHSQHGHCDSRSLKSWMCHQRNNLDKLTLHQKQMLNSLGFDWTTDEEKRQREWDVQFDKLTKYQERFGHVNMLNNVNNSSATGALAVWLSTQMQRHRCGKLLPLEKDKLERIGVQLPSLQDLEGRCVTTHDHKWEFQFQRLLQYKQKHGHLHLCAKNTDDPVLLRWAHSQKYAYRNGRLRQDRLERLQQIDFPLNGVEAGQTLTAAAERRRRRSPQPTTQDAAAAAAAAGQQSASPPTKTTAATPASTLTTTVRKQDAAAAGQKQDAASAGQQRKQSASPPTKTTAATPASTLTTMTSAITKKAPSKWVSYWKRLRQFQEIHGHTHVTRTDDASLCDWVQRQIRRREAGKLSPNRTLKLETLRLDWTYNNNNPDSSDNNNKSRSDSSDSSPDSSDNNNKNNKSRSDSDNNKSRSDSDDNNNNKSRSDSNDNKTLGHDNSSPSDDKKKWNHMYKLLVDYYKTQGHTNVPSTPVNDLYAWTCDQRLAAQNGSLRPEYKTKLQEIGFVFAEKRSSVALTTKEDQAVQTQEEWDEMFDMLCLYKLDYGNCNVAENHPERAILTSWVCQQRKLQGQGRLLTRRCIRLAAVGFCDAPKQQQLIGTKRKSSPVKLDDSFATLVLQNEYGLLLSQEQEPCAPTAAAAKYDEEDPDYCEMEFVDDSSIPVKMSDEPCSPKAAAAAKCDEEEEEDPDFGETEFVNDASSPPVKTSDEEECKPKVEHPYVGRRVAKYFSDALYKGTVSQFISAQITTEGVDLWTIEYDDDDKEDMDEAQVVEAMELYESRC